MVSIVAVTSNDALEPQRPGSGSMLRIRCAWENTPQGILRSPLSEFVRLKVDGQEVTPKLFSTPRPNGLHGEHHYRWPITNLPPGKHTATATVRVLATKAEVSRSVEFAV
jgi:hypothetical protein